MENVVFSVTELNNRIKLLLDGDDALARVCVRGELSNYKRYPSGHHYFTLKDAGGSLRCVMFKSAASGLRWEPENGMAVLAAGRVTVYPRDGAYQLYCDSLTPEGLGDLFAAFEQLKKKLSAEGLFDPAHKKPIPRFPGRIAVVTSSAGAAVRDIIRVLKKRWPLTEVLLLPVRVQGAEAPAEIAGAINYVNRWSLADVIIEGRGGGSMEDLWAFNDERVARAIYASDIPVISAVGHEPDFTISDFVADLRAATPSNAAELAVPDILEMRETLRSLGIRQFKALEKRLFHVRSRLSDFASRRVMRSPSAYYDMKRMELDSLSGRLTASAGRAVEKGRREETRLAASLDALSPLKVLGRGYSIVSDEEGKTVKDTACVRTGDMLNVRLERGVLACRVEEKRG